MFGRRSDGRKLKRISPFLKLIPFIMNRRTDSMNMMTFRVDLEGMRRFIQKCRDRGIAMSYMNIIIAAYARTVALHPSLNRFIVNKRIYARNELAVSFVALKKYEEQGAVETTIKATLSRSDNVFAISERIHELVGINKQKDQENEVDIFIDKIMRFPLLLTAIVGACKLMDRYGLLPRGIVDISPFHTSLFLTNMASIRMPFIHHHLYEFGTTTVFLAMGSPEWNVTGESKAQVMPLGIVVDERICEGAVYAMAFKTLLRFLANPELLEEDCKDVCEDVK